MRKNDLFSRPFLTGSSHACHYYRLQGLGTFLRIGDLGTMGFSILFYFILSHFYYSLILCYSFLLHPPNAPSQSPITPPRLPTTPILGFDSLTGARLVGHVGAQRGLPIRCQGKLRVMRPVKLS